ncbi:sugar ABC transporter substrate-binding protein [Cellulomonas sp. ATA003]|uniref:ABC transporter substrate-binding protein n=1 Tax=Cellulomonas sp. ATA003 TaxID=3073064 RepID=UPI002873B3AC|nr:sugar ABC transporter substrate-binding protein [Cellulomonas sp. ATA003]WNB85872.1 sugar ABC transporter substrate-binding protein [Cellulomonas sp. ATA003]
MKSRGLTAMAGAAAVALALTACQQGSATAPDDADAGGDQAAGEPITLEFQSLAGQPAAIAAVDDIVAAWNADNPDVQVEIVPAGWDGIYDKLVAQFNGGAAPDILHFEAASIIPFGVDGYLADLTDHITPEVRDDVPEGIWESVTVDGQIIAYPTMLQSYMVFANTALLEAAGVEVPTGDTMTWDELREIARATTSDGVYGLTWGLRSPTATVMSLSMGFDGDFFEGEGTDVTIDVGDDELAVPQRIHQMAYEDGSIDPVSLTQSGSEVLAGFYGGTAAMTVQGSFQAANIADDAPEGFEWTVLPPLEGSADAEQAANPQTYSVNVDSEHVEESAEFLNFLMSAENLAALNMADALIPTTESARAELATMTADQTGWDQILKSADHLTSPAFMHVGPYTQWKDTIATPSLQRYLANEIDLEGLQTELTEGWEQTNR